MAGFNDKVSQVIGGSPYGRGVPSPQMVGPQEGVIRKIGTMDREVDGVRLTGAAARFILPDYDGGKHIFGPAPFGHRGGYLGGTTPTETVEVTHEHLPRIGDLCLVVFVGAGIDRPWVLEWWPGRADWQPVVEPPGATFP